MVAVGRNYTSSRNKKICNIRINVTLRHLPIPTAAVEKQQLSGILSVCVRRFNFIQSACVILSSVDCPSLQYISTLSHELHNFQEKINEHKNIFWFSLQLLSETFLNPRSIQRDVINVHTSSCIVTATTFFVVFPYMLTIIQLLFQNAHVFYY
jgi:hypothetical protein